jgi:ATP-binding cassette subfamily C (CFTR/MRP) protein 1
VNAVERVLWYAEKETLPQEKPHTIDGSTPERLWPAEGRVSFENVSMSYRPGLPAVLKGM